MKTKKIFMIIIAVLILYCAICAIKPFWDRYWLGQDLQTAAIYGTKHSVGDTRKYLSRIMEDKGYGFSGEDFYIEQNANKDTTIGIVYDDEIRIFGATILEFELSAEKTHLFIKSTF